MRRIVGVLVLAAAVAACDDGTGLNGEAAVSVDFVSQGATTSGSLLGSPAALTAAAIALDGTNGVLTLETAHVVLNEFELERADDLAGCDDDSSSDDDGSDDGSDDDSCSEIEQGPLFLELPLESGERTSVSGQVPAGVYDEIEFEIEDLEDDADEPGEAERIAALLAEIRGQFPEWPREASMRVAGTFTPEGGEAEPFVAYFEAEIEIEMEFDTPFEVTESDVSRTITVELDPRDWFVRSDGTVMDLTEWDYASTGRVLEFEVEIENGFKTVEHDDD